MQWMIGGGFWLLSILTLFGATRLDGANQEPVAWLTSEDAPAAGVIPHPTPLPGQQPTYSLSGAVSEDPSEFPSPTPATQGVEQWRPLVAAIFGEGPVDTVLAVMRCESGGDPDIVSVTNDHGLLQINGVNHHRFTDTFGSAADPYDPAQNLEVARQMSSNGTDWWAWSCKP